MAFNPIEPIRETVNDQIFITPFITNEEYVVDIEYVYDPIPIFYLFHDSVNTKSVPIRVQPYQDGSYGNKVYIVHPKNGTFQTGNTAIFTKDDPSYLYANSNWFNDHFTYNNQALTIIDEYINSNNVTFYAFDVTEYATIAETNEIKGTRIVKASESSINIKKNNTYVNIGNNMRIKKSNTYKKVADAWVKKNNSWYCVYHDSTANEL